jgi:hypothetical protein
MQEQIIKSKLSRLAPVLLPSWNDLRGDLACPAQMVVASLLAIVLGRVNSKTLQIHRISSPKSLPLSAHTVTTMKSNTIVNHHGRYP